MIIQPPEIHVDNGSVIVSARIETLQNVPGLPERLWFSFPERYSPWISTSSDGFASSLIQLAMYLEEDLEIPGSVSPRLAYGLQEYQHVFHSWFPKQFAKIGIHFDRFEIEKFPSAPQAIVTAFSGGVDSFYTLWCHLPENQPIPDARISHGLFVHGFDVPLAHVEAYTKFAGQYQDLFQRLGLTLLTASTNAYAFWRYRLRWDYVHGGPLIGLAQVLAGLIKRIYIPATRSYLDSTPLGTSPITDHLLSTDRMEVIHFGGAKPRIDKLEAINAFPEAQHLLRVCTNLSSQHEVTNCAHCSKCKYTYCMLDVLGVAGNFSGLPKGYRNWDMFKWGFASIHPVYLKQIMKHALKPLRLDIWLPLLVALLVGSIRSAVYWKVINRIPKTSFYRFKRKLFATKEQ